MEVYNTCSGTPDAAADHVSHLRGVHGSVPEVDCTISSAEGYNRKWICKCLLSYVLDFMYAWKETPCLSVPYLSGYVREI